MSAALYACSHTFSQSAVDSLASRSGSASVTPLDRALPARCKERWTERFSSRSRIKGERAGIPNRCENGRAETGAHGELRMACYHELPDLPLPPLLSRRASKARASHCIFLIAHLDILSTFNSLTWLRVPCLSACGCSDTGTIVIPSSSLRPLPIAAL